MSTIAQMPGERLLAQTFGIQANGQNSPAGGDEFGKYLPSAAAGSPKDLAKPTPPESARGEGLSGSIALPTEIGPGRAGGPDGCTGLMPSDVWSVSARGPDVSSTDLIPTDVWSENTRGPDVSSTNLMPTDVWSENTRGPDVSDLMPTDANTRGPDVSFTDLVPTDLWAESTRGPDVSDLMPTDANTRGPDVSFTDLMPTEVWAESTGSPDASPTDLMPIDVWPVDDGSSTSREAESGSGSLPVATVDRFQLMESARLYAVGSLLNSVDPQTVSKIL